MKRTSELSNKTKAELVAMARRKKIPVTSSMAKDELIKTIKKGLRKIEAQKKSKTATAKTRKRTPAAKATRQTSKKKKAKASKVKTARKPAVLKKSPAKGKTKKTSVKKSATRKPKTVRTPKAVQSQMRPQPVETELPERYGDHRLVVLARDPNWAYAYWDLNPTKVRNLLKSAGQTANKARWVLRVYAAALHPVEDKTHYFDIDTLVQGGNYYINLSRPGARFIVEIGVMDTTGLFRATAQSNPVIMPMDHPSETLAQESTFSEDIISRNVSSFSNPSSSRSK
jgi:hypothetical protein